jgi:hypothetical protein
MILNYFFKQISRALAVLLILNTNIMANEQPDYTVIKKITNLKYVNIQIF